MDVARACSLARFCIVCQCQLCLRPAHYSHSSVSVCELTKSAFDSVQADETRRAASALSSARGDRLGSLDKCCSSASTCSEVFSREVMAWPGLALVPLTVVSRHFAACLSLGCRQYHLQIFRACYSASLSLHLSMQLYLAAAACLLLGEASILRLSWASGRSSTLVYPPLSWVISRERPGWGLPSYSSPCSQLSPGE